MEVCSCTRCWRRSAKWDTILILMLCSCPLPLMDETEATSSACRSFSQLSWSLWKYVENLWRNAVVSCLLLSCCPKRYQVVIVYWMGSNHSYVWNGFSLYIAAVSASKAAMIVFDSDSASRARTTVSSTSWGSLLVSWIMLRIRAMVFWYSNRVSACAM